MILENFEDIFFDDLVQAIENLDPPKSGIGSFESGWDAAVDACVHKLHSFFGRSVKNSENGNSENTGKDIPLDEAKQELLKAFIPSPSSGEHHAWNSAVRTCMLRLANLVGAGKDWIGDNMQDFCIWSVEGGGHESTEGNNVNHPPYYTYATMEVIDVIEGLHLPFHLGNALKYMARAGRKNPDETITDLQKAIWYINRYIKFLEE